MTAADTLTPSEPDVTSDAQNLGEWHRLRSLLFASEQASLNALAAKVGDRHSLARSVAGVLSEAASIRGEQDDSFARVLAPVVEESLQQSVRKNPQPLVDALYPIMGPAIRRSISETLADMMQAFNGAVEQSFSPRALKWRFDAWRTGQSYASVVLLKTLVYRVEQVFLIHRETGLLLCHAQADQVVIQDPDMVSGMLTAIRDFVSDSFHVSHEDGVDAIRLGDLSVQVRVGPKAVLAAVVRGSTPESLRIQLSETLEHIHRTHGVALNQFNGNSDIFANAVESLRPCLAVQTRAAEPRAPWRAYMALSVIAILGGWWAIARHQANAGWNAVLQELEREPGLVVIEADRDGRHSLQGLRDPLARDPRQIIGAERMHRYDIQWTWKPFLSMEPQLLLRRARQVLNPPQDVSLRIDGDVLHASGVASASWMREARSRAAFLPGIRTFDDSSLVPDSQVIFDHARQALTSAVVYFDLGSDLLLDAQRAKLDGLQQSLIALRDSAAELQIEYSVEVVGRADAPGTTAINLHLSQSRADAVRQYLMLKGMSALRVHARGIGWIDPSAGASEPVSHNEALDTERRVNFMVIPARSGQQLSTAR
jgi:outer membrane protein OmpA-like peptidoglycan-associated protein